MDKRFFSVLALFIATILTIFSSFKEEPLSSIKYYTNQDHDPNTGEHECEKDITFEVKQSFSGNLSHWSSIHCKEHFTVCAIEIKDNEVVQVERGYFSNE